MVTRLELRNSLRVRLQDEGLAPLWTDAQCNEFLSEALREYGRWEPAEGTAAGIVVASGATTFAAPAAVTGPVIRVRDGAGNGVPPMSDIVGGGPTRSAYTAQSWRLWSGSIVLARAVGTSEAGNWAVDYLGNRELPAADGTAVAIEPGREVVVVALAAWQAARHREFEDYKRGAKAPARSYGQGLYDEARRLYAQGSRAVRSGTLQRG